MAPGQALWILGLLTAVATEATSAVPEAVCEEEEVAPPSVLLLQTNLQHQLRPVGSAAPEEAGAAAALDKHPSLVASPPTPAPAAAGSGAPKAWPRGSSQAFVFLFEWSWDDIAVECETFLGPKGFTAVQVSPPNEHAQGASWDARYKPVSYNLTSRSGNETQFASMLQRCNAAGVAVYADAVFNQQAPMSGTGVAGSPYGYRTYPLFGPEDFHHLPGDSNTNCGVSDYKNQHNIQYCDLMGMPDLCTGCPHVQEMVAAYINRMASLGIAGFRVDAAKHMDPVELKGILDRVNSTLYRFQEVTAVMNEAVQTPMYFSDGPVTEFGYGATLGPKFIKEGQLQGDFASFGEGWGLVASDKAVVFLDNHDSQRNGQAALTYRAGDLYTLANVFMLAYPYGFPRLMSSYYFDDASAGPPSASVHGPGGVLRCGKGQPWVCEHRTEAIANMVLFRRTAGDLPVANFVAAGNTMAFCRGNAACVAINRGSADAWEVELHTSLPQGEYCDVTVSDNTADCPRVRVGNNGAVKLNVQPLSAVAIHINAYTQPQQEEAEEDLQDSEPLD